MSHQPSYTPMLEFDSLLQKCDHAICSMMQQLQDVPGKAATTRNAACTSPRIKIASRPRSPYPNYLIPTHDAQACPAKQCGRSPVWQKLRMPPASALAHRLAVICQALACWPQRHCSRNESGRCRAAWETDPSIPCLIPGTPILEHKHRGFEGSAPQT